MLTDVEKAELILKGELCHSCHGRFRANGGVHAYGGFAGDDYTQCKLCWVRGLPRINDALKEHDEDAN